MAPRTVKADLSLCQGYGNCVVAADDYFDLDDDGLVVVLTAEVSDEALDKVEAAVRSCPVSALTIVEP